MTVERNFVIAFNLLLSMLCHCEERQRRGNLNRDCFANARNDRRGKFLILRRVDHVEELDKPAR